MVSMGMETRDKNRRPECVFLDPGVIEEIDLLVKYGIHGSREEAIKEAIRHYIKHHSGNTGIPFGTIIKGENSVKIILPVIGLTELPYSLLKEISTNLNLPRSLLIQAIAKNRHIRKHVESICKKIDEHYGHKQYEKTVEKLSKWIAEHLIEHLTKHQKENTNPQP